MRLEEELGLLGDDGDPEEGEPEEGDPEDELGIDDDCCWLWLLLQADKASKLAVATMAIERALEVFIALFLFGLG